VKSIEERFCIGGFDIVQSAIQPPSNACDCSALSSAP
jgi:hypothetical protein